MSHFEAASKIRSGKLHPHYNLGTAFVEMNIGDALARKGQPDEAMAHFEQAITLQPDYAEAYFNRGNVLYAKGRIDEAITDWEKDLQIQPNDANAHTGRFSDAIAVTQQAVAIARTQGKTSLENLLEEDALLYRENVPLRRTSAGD